jgi:hypothetical protein
MEIPVSRKTENPPFAKMSVAPWKIAHPNITAEGGDEKEKSGLRQAWGKMTEPDNLLRG